MLKRENDVSSTTSSPASWQRACSSEPGADDVAPGQLVPLGEGGEAGRHRPQRLVGLQVGLVEDQEGAARLQRPRATAANAPGLSAGAISWTTRKLMATS